MQIVLAFLFLSLWPMAQALAALNVSMSIAPTYSNPIYPGDVTAFRITLTNSNIGSSVTNAAFTNTMPSIVNAGVGLKAYSCFDGAGASATTTGTVTANVGANTITLANGTIPAAGVQSGRCDIDVEVTSTTQGLRTNTINIGAVTGTDTAGVSNGSAATQTITVQALANPTISKSFNSTTVVKSDQTVRLTITVSNTSNSVNLPLTTITDNLPAGLIVAGAPNAGTPNPSVSCTGAGASPPTFSPVAGASTLTITGGAVGANGVCTIQVDVVGTTTAGSFGNGVTNTINRSTQFGNTRGLVPPSDATASLTINSPLGVSKNFSPSTVSAGQQATLTITLINGSPLNALTLTSFTDNPIDGTVAGAGHPAYGLLISATPTTSCTGGAVVATANNTGITLTGGSIPAAGSCTITVLYTATLQSVGVPQSFTNTIPAGAVGLTDASIVSQPAVHSVTVVDRLTVSKNSSPATVAPGNPVTYTVTINNYAATAVSGVQFTDTLPAGMVALPSPAPVLSGAGCTSLAHTIPALPATTGAPQFTFNMPAGSGPNPGVCTVTFTAMAPTGSVVGQSRSNSIGAGGVCGTIAGPTTICNNGASNSASYTLSDVATVSKVFAPNSLSEGSVSQLTISFTNLSANAVTNGTVTDNLPLAGARQLVIANPANASTTCGAAAITATPGAASVGMTGATIRARAANGAGANGSCTLKVNVIGGAGNYTNTLNAGSLTATETYPNGGTNGISSPGPVSASISYSSALTAIKSFSPATIQDAGTSTVTIRVGNTGSGTLNGVAITDPLPSGMTIANPANAYTTCGGTTAITAVPGASSAGMTGTIIPASGQCELLFDVTATGGAGTWVNTIPSGNIVADGGVSNVASVSATLTKSAGTLNVTNSTSPNSLTAPGEVSILTITLGNTGAFDLGNVSLTDYFTVGGTVGGALSGMRVAATPGASTTCPGGVVTAAADGTTLTLTGASLASTASCNVKVNVTMRTVGTIQNTIPVGAVTTAQGVSNTLSTTTSLSAQANIGVSKQFIPTVVRPGDRARLRLTFINPIALPVASLATTDNLPGGLTIPPGPNPTTTCTGATVTTPTSTQLVVSTGSLPSAGGGVSATCQVEIDVVAAAAGAYTNTIPTGGVTGIIGGGPVSTPVPASAVLQARIPVGIAKAFNASSVSPGVPSQLTITLTNTNTIALTGAALIDNLPSGLTVALTPNASTTCAGGVITATASATSIAIAGATIPASGACVVRVDTVSNTPGIYVNTIPSAALTTAEGVGNEDPATATVTVSDPPIIGKQLSPVSIPVGGMSTLTIVIGNTNAAALTLTANFTDTLPTAPGNVVIAATPAASTTCGGTLIANAGAAFVQLNSGGTIPLGGCSISVQVTGNTAGTHINSIGSGALQTSLGNNLQPANASLVISTLGYVSGRVFKDNNVTPDGVYQVATDTPIAAQTIQLLDNTNAVIATTATDALGNYAFFSLAPGTYSVRQPAQPAGTVNGITSPGAIVGIGGTAGSATAIGTLPSQISSIVLGTDAGQVNGSLNNNFAEVVQSSISGTVFLDQNNNGVLNGVDTPLAGVAIQLLNNVGTVIATTGTDAGGNYAFGNLAPGTYSIRQPTQPAATSNGLTVPGAVSNGGTPGTATTSTVVPSLIANLVLPPNTTSVGNNFAEIPNGRVLSGRVFLDYNNNGTLGGIDHGIGGQTINLSGIDINSNPVNASTVSAADGSYAFAGLPPGSYAVAQPIQPAGTTNGITSAGSTGGTATLPGVAPSQITAISLTGANTVSADNNFAEIPGPAPDLAIVKTHSPVSFAEGSSSGYYTITVSNIGSVASAGTVTMTGTLPAGISFLSAPASGSWSCGAAGQTVTCSSSAAIAPASSAPAIILRVAVGAGLGGQILTNNAVVSGGGEPAGFDGNNSASDPTVISQVASVQGTVWRDLNHDRILDAGETRIPGWIVELVLGGVVVGSTATDANGAYNLANLAPGSGYQLRFREPVSGTIYGRPVPNETGAAFANGVTSSANPAGASNVDGTLQSLTLVAGTNTVQQSLPLDPSGVIYDSVTRQPVRNAVATLSAPGLLASQVVGGTLTQTTGSDGFYQFLLLAGAPTGGSLYTLTVMPPAGYLPAPSTLIAPCTATLAVGVPPPDPALIQNSNIAPAAGTAIHNPATCPATTAMLPGGAASTQYYYRFTFEAVPGSTNVVNNHIPVDPILGGALFMTKSTPLVNVVRGDLVPYTVTATNTLAAALGNINVVDVIPAGFRYRTGSATLNGAALEPVVSGRNLTWSNRSFAAGERKTWRMILMVGTGVGEGNYINQVSSLNNLVNNPVSNVATASVRVVPDPTFDCSDIIGKVFDDKNANGYQDDGEPGIANVRIATARGLLVTTDHEGRFHVACAAIPDADRGSNFVMKLDERTLPSGYRLTTENPRDVRVTRGKMLKLNFGAAIHRVIRLELSAAAFVADGTELQPAHAARLQQLPALLNGRPSVARIAYARGMEDEQLARRRIGAIARQLQTIWQAQRKEEHKDAEPIHPLVIETEMEGAR